MPTEMLFTATEIVWPGVSVVFSNSISNARLVPDALYSALPRPPTVERNVAFRSGPSSRDEAVRVAAAFNELIARVVGRFRVGVTGFKEARFVEARFEAVRSIELPCKSDLDELAPRESLLVVLLLLLAEPLPEVPVELDLLDSLPDEPLLEEPLCSEPSLCEPLCSDSSSPSESNADVMCVKPKVAKTAAAHIRNRRNWIMILSRVVDDVSQSLGQRARMHSKRLSCEATSHRSNSVVWGVRKTIGCRVAPRCSVA